MSPTQNPDDGLVACCVDICIAVTRFVSAQLQIGARQVAGGPPLTREHTSKAFHTSKKQEKIIKNVILSILKK